jgi:aminopeptidase
MPDQRLEQYARLLVDTCIDVQPGWQVLVVGTPLGRPLVEEVTRQIARRGAYALLRVHFGGPLFASRTWLREAPLELIGAPSSIEEYAFAHCDAIVAIEAPENTRDAGSLDQDRTAAVQAAYRPGMERIYQGVLPWVGCQYPTPAAAQEAGMSTDEFTDFLYGAVLRDWDVERERMQRYADRFEAADEVRILGAETDLQLSIAGRSMEVDAGGANVPGGELFGCPVEDSAEGVITFSEFPAIYAGREIPRIRLRFANGEVVDAAADANESFLLATLDQDEGARRLGELGIGCNPGITRYMKNTLFDEKIDGTVHLALGNSIAELGGMNVSTIHWDIVKDLRSGGRIELDGTVVQENGVWRI